MRKSPDITGQQFGRLTAVQKVNATGRARWLCKCSCGRTTVVDLCALQSGATKSCGCLQKERASAVGLGNTKYVGKDEQRIADVYEGMKKRCYNPHNHNYKNYGARGISICDEWLHDKPSFVQWSLKNGYKQGLSIDRIDNDGPYSPDNCRWASLEQQHNNRRDNRLVTVDGETHSIAEWSRKLRLDQSALYRLSDARIVYAIKKGMLNHGTHQSN